MLKTLPTAMEVESDPHYDMTTDKRVPNHAHVMNTCMMIEKIFKEGKHLKYTMWMCNWELHWCILLVNSLAPVTTLIDRYGCGENCKLFMLLYRTGQGHSEEDHKCPSSATKVKQYPG